MHLNNEGIYIKIDYTLKFDSYKEIYTYEQNSDSQHKKSFRQRN